MKTVTGESGIHKAINLRTFSAGLVGAVVGCTGPLLIIIDSASLAGLTNEQTVSWIFACYVGGGLFGIFLSLKYRQPLCGAFNVAGVVFLGTALVQFNYQEAIGAYLITGLLLLILGLTGLVDKAMKWIPMPIIMAMIAGVLLSFAYGMMDSFKTIPWQAAIILTVYLGFRRWYAAFPPILAAFIIGIGITGLTGGINLPDISPGFSGPILYTPTFSLGAVLAISLPLLVLILGTENAQAIGVLKANGYEPPVNAITAGTGIGTMIAGIFGGHSVVAAGMMTAVCVTPEVGPKETRYGAGVINAVIFGSCGLFAGYTVYYVSAFPVAFIKLVAGLALINVIDNALRMAFGNGKFRMGAFFAFVIAGSGVVFHNISAPFWAIIGGLLVAVFLERDDFTTEKQVML
jgi:benzoate membrane transport protein